jgi:hypothetical protein
MPILYVLHREGPLTVCVEIQKGSYMPAHGTEPLARKQRTLCCTECYAPQGQRSV